MGATLVCMYGNTPYEDCGARACPVHGTASADPYGPRQGARVHDPECDMDEDCTCAHMTTATYYPCDADGYPLWLTPCTEEESRQYGPHHLMPAASFTLLWASRWGNPARWLIVPR